MSLKGLLSNGPANVEWKISAGILTGIALSVLVSVGISPILGTGSIGVGLMTALFLSIIAANAPTVLAI